MAKTKIVSTKKKDKSAHPRRKWAKTLTRKVHRTHKGYSMKAITKGQMTYKRGKKR